MFPLHDWQHRRRAGRIARIVAPYLSEGDTVLDFGCGDMSIAREIESLKQVSLCGLDVLPNGSSGMPFVYYSGIAVPFKSKSFDTTICSFALHHVYDVDLSLKECIRATRKRLLILEDVYTNSGELLMLKILDTFGKLTYKLMHFPFNFRTEDDWVKTFRYHSLTLVETKPIRPDGWRPARHRLFVLDIA